MENEKDCMNNAICDTCLSTDRRCTVLKCSDFPIVIQNVTMNKDKNMCWECRADIKKMVRFTRRAALAEEFLSNYIENNKIKTLSTLSVRKKDTYDVILTDGNGFPFEYVDQHDSLEMKQETNENDPTPNRDDQDLNSDPRCNIFDPDSAKDDPIICVKDERRGDSRRDILEDKDNITDNSHKKRHRVRNVVGLRKRQVKKETNSISNGSINELERERLRKRAKVRKRPKVEDNQYDDLIDDDPITSDVEIEKDSDTKISKNVKIRKEQIDNLDELKREDNTEDRDNKIGRNTKKRHSNKIEVNIEEFKEENIIKVEDTSKDEKKQVDTISYEPNGYIVSSLTEEELFYLRDKQRNSTIYRRNLHKCDTCIISFRTSEKLKEHFDEFHCEIVGPYVCNICSQRNPDSIRHTEHMKLHLVIYKCVLCKHKNFNLNNMRAHVKNNHGKEYSCTTCNVTFQSKGAARYHIKTHNLQQCKLCGKEYADLKIHMVSHSKSRTEQCSICNKLLKSKTSLRFHLLTHTTARKDEAYCTECDVHFKSKHIYRMHLKTNAKHTVPDKECDYCHRKFISKFTLAKHISVVHYNKLDHICHLCGKKFSIAGHLRDHISVHHEGLSKPKKHVCDLCGKGFAVKKCLTDHLNTHTGARPYKCNVCAAQFGFKSALYMHNRLKHLKGKKGRQKGEFSLDPTGQQCP